MSADLPPDVEAAVAEIAADREHGASWLSRQALRVVARCAEQSAARTPSVLLQQVATCADALIAARPGMAPLRYWMEWLLRDLDSAAENGLALDDLRSAIVTLVASLVGEAERAGRAVAEDAVARLPAGSVVFTASLSQTVREALRLANRSGTLRSVLAAESVDASGHSYGHDVAVALRADGVSVEVVPDEALARRIGDATRVWLGADSIFLDGSALNGIPSRALAQAARAAHRPVDVLGESAKIDRLTAPEAAVVPPGFDRIPADLITTIVTEKGTSKPSDIAGMAEAGSRSRPDPLPAREETLTPSPSEMERGRGGEAGVALVAAIAEALIERQESVAVAESAAGGRIGDLLTDRPGSSAWFAGGLLPYSNAAKQHVAGLSAEALAEHGAVSAETAIALAESARRLFGADWGIGETGIAGPQTGRRSRKPAGLAYVAVVGPGDLRRSAEVNTGADARSENKQAFAMAALQLFAEELEKVR